MGLYIAAIELDLYGLCVRAKEEMYNEADKKIGHRIIFFPSRL